MVLRGATLGMLKTVAQGQIDKVLQQEGQLTMMQLCAIHKEDSLPDLMVHPMTTTIDTAPDLKQLLSKYSEVFNEPTGLPLFRPGFDHKIALKDGSNPINLRPYKYPLLQKDVIEQLTQELIEQRVIRPRSSAFASPRCW